MIIFELTKVMEVLLLCGKSNRKNFVLIRQLGQLYLGQPLYKHKLISGVFLSLFSAA